MKQFLPFFSFSSVQSRRLERWPSLELGGLFVSNLEKQLEVLTKVLFFLDPFQHRTNLVSLSVFSSDRVNEWAPLRSQRMEVQRANKWDDAEVPVWP